MKFYSVDTGNESSFVAKIDDAKAIVKQAAPVFRASVLVTELEIPTDKENVLMILNGDAWKSQSLRTWCGTARGGLAEVSIESSQE